MWQSRVWSGHVTSTLVATIADASVTTVTRVVSPQPPSLRLTFTNIVDDMDVDEFFREQDRRMSIPDDDMDEFIEQMKLEKKR
ncbi:hypothetical protein PM082_019961 [Marasmius tenuissimus]|nr:hypothetical protein PM082_019961 [Marasmius tenuissimus]